MCVKPLQIYRYKPALGYSTLDTVPCGRCVECLAAKRSQFAAQAVIEAKKYGSLFFATFTYSNEKIPLLVTARHIVGGEIVHKWPSKPIIEEHRESYINRMIERYKSSSRYRPDSKYQNSLDPIDFDIFVVSDDEVINCQVTPSLDRKSFRLWLKAFRMRYLRDTGALFPESFKYTVFGEYGDWSARPHFHAIFTGIGYQDMARLAKDFGDRFGHCDYYAVKEINPDGSPGFIKASKYVSKYISKQQLSLATDLNGYVEKPRKCSSRGFGRLSDEDLKRYRDYFYGFDYYRYNPSNPIIPESKKAVLFNLVNERKHCFIIDGCRFNTPEYIIREFFYRRVDRSVGLEEECCSDKLKSCGSCKKVWYFGRTRYVYRATKLQKMVVDFARSQNLALSRRQLLEYYEISGQNIYMAAQKFTDHEQAVFEDRESRAQTYYLNSLKTQVYA